MKEVYIDTVKKIEIMNSIIRNLVIASFWGGIVAILFVGRALQKCPKQ